METPQTNLFELKIDELSNSYLLETAKWAKFLSILGFIVCGLMLLGGIAMASAFADMGNLYGKGNGLFGSSVAFSFIYLAIAALYFFPCLYLYRFASSMKMALQAGEPIQLQASFKNLKSSFRFVGILTIIVLGFYALLIVGMSLFAAFSL